MAKAKGIRISDLAKELGVTAKSILEQIHKEGIESDKEYKTSSSIPLGLAESVKDWKAAGLLKSADDANVAVADRPKRALTKKKSANATADDTTPPADAAEASAFEEPAPMEEQPLIEAIDQPVFDPNVGDATGADVTDEALLDADAPLTEEAPADIETAPAMGEADDAAAAAGDDAATRSPITPAPRLGTPASATTRGPKVVTDAAPVHRKPSGQSLAIPAFQGRPASAPAAKGQVTSKPQPAKPAAAMPPAQGGAPGSPLPPAIAPPAGGAAAAAAAAARSGQPHERALKPTVTIDSLSAPRPAPPRLVTPTKAVVKGPALIREEKPDVVSAPRPRGPRVGGGPGGPPGSFNAMAPRGGAGVRRTDGGEGSDEEEQKKKAAAARGPVGRRKTTDGRRGLAEEKLKEFTEADLIERRDRLNEAARYRSGVDLHMRPNVPGQRGRAETPGQRGGPIEIEEPISVKSLSAALGIKSQDILKSLIKKGVFATVNQSLAFDAAETIAREFGLELAIMRAPTLEEQLMAEYESRPRDEANLVLRPPVVTILGHVDHGKTSLLDKIRSANVAAGEAGGITQHIAAFSVELDRNGEKKRVTFIDTPGHQAFTAMRARGANMTDVAVLVVDAAQGIQPQTVESINHSRAAGVPIVVALNKIDLPDANPDMAMGQLAQQDLNPVAWGGQTEMVQTSGKTGQGIEDLIEILDLQSQVLELKADPTSPARGTVIEARVDPGLGSVATVLVQDGTLKVGDVVLAGQGYGRIRQLRDSTGKFIEQAGPSTPVLIAGLSEVPSAGDKFFVVSDVDRAKQIAEERLVFERSQQKSQSRVSFENLIDTIKEGDIKTINLIVKADVQGSVETLQKTVTDFNTGEVQVKVIHAAVGPINESDVDLASASGAVIVGFHVATDPVAQQQAEARRVEIRTYRVIYEIFDDLKKALSGMLEPEIREKHHGWVEIRQVFKVSRIGNIAGCYVTEGHIQRGSKIRLVRDGNIVAENLTIDTLRRVKEDVKEVKTGFECGIKLAGYDDIKVGDKLEAYVREEIKRVL